jgi:hypothetical protein
MVYGYTDRRKPRRAIVPRRPLVAGPLLGHPVLDASLPISRARSTRWWAPAEQRRFNMTLLMVLAGIALVLAIAGIYGTTAYAVAQRRDRYAGRHKPGDRGPGVVGFAQARHGGPR